MNEINPCKVRLTDPDHLRYLRESSLSHDNGHRTRTNKRKGREIVAKKAKVSTSTVRRLEEGNNVRWDNWEAVAQHFNLDPYSDCGVILLDSRNRPLTWRKEIEGDKSQRTVCYVQADFKESDLRKKSCDQPSSMESTDNHNSRNPLMCLETDEHRAFVGKEHDILQASQKIITGFTEPGKRPVAAIAGDRYSGKSSFLRAGLIANLKQYLGEIKIQTVCIRPTEFLIHTAKPAQILSEFFSSIEEQTQLRVPHRDIHHLTRYNRSDNGTRAVSLIEQQLHSFTKKNVLLIGLDQFEELLLCLHEPNMRLAWEPLVDFIRAACAADSIGFAYTLDRNQPKLLQESGLPSCFVDPLPTEMRAFDEEFLKKLIDHPFSIQEMELDKDLSRAVLVNCEMTPKNRTRS